MYVLRTFLVLTTLEDKTATRRRSTCMAWLVVLPRGSPTFAMLFCQPACARSLCLLQIEADLSIATPISILDQQYQVVRIIRTAIYVYTVDLG